MTRSGTGQNTLARVRIEKELLRLVGPHLTPREASRIAEGVNALPREVVARLIEWTEIFARLHAELGAGFVRHAGRVAAETGFAGHEPWARRAAEAFDHRGLGAALAVVNDPDGFVEAFRRRERGCRLDAIRRRLGTFLEGLGPPGLRLVKGPRPTTDGARVFLPEAVHAFASPEDNYLMYRSLAVFLWSEVRFGTLDPVVLSGLAEREDSEALAERFIALETVRLVSCLERTVPGIVRQMLALSARVDRSAQWRDAGRPQLAAALRRPEASAVDSLTAAPGLDTVPPPPCFRGVFDLALIREAEAAGSVERAPDAAAPAPAGADAERVREAMRPGPAGSGGAPEARRNGGPAGQAGGSRSLAAGTTVSGVSALAGEATMPPAATSAAPGPYPAAARDGAGAAPPGYDAVGAGESIEFVSEWDYERHCYRDDYCTVRIRDGDAGDESFVSDALGRHRGMVKSIKRRFEALTGAPVIERHQEDGDQIDVDALVEAYADRTAGLGFSEYLYRRRTERARDIAALFLVDMSGSTRGWVNQAEREALVLMCEAFSLLGDRYAIFGFSGRTHKRCEIYRIKAFDQRYDLGVKRRIAGIAPKGYTRLGAPIRVLTRRLVEIPAKHRLLVTISDGKPEDYRSYRGRYGIEDTRQALVEARRRGVHAFCITIDETGGDYLPRMYGPANFVVVDDVMQLPYRLAEVYRRLTS